MGEDGNLTDIIIKGSYLLSLVRREKRQDEEEKGSRLESSHDQGWPENITIKEAAQRSQVIDGDS